MPQLDLTWFSMKFFLSWLLILLFLSVLISSNFYKKTKNNSNTKNMKTKNENNKKTLWPI